MREWQQAAAAALIRSPAWIYRDFTHVGGGKMPDAKTMGRWGVALGRAVLKQFTRMVRMAHDNGVTAGRRMRVDTTVGGDQHPPSDRQHPAGRSGHQRCGWRRCHCHSK
jgi:hypothetical protein